MLYNIKSDLISVLVSSHGAELQSIVFNDASYLWNGDSRYWSGRATNIFPYVARLTEGRYLYKDKSYYLDIHGFVHHSEFYVESHGKNHISFCLRSDAETRKVYPFDFLYRVIYHLHGTWLEICYEVENLGEDMYFGLGGHPGFMVPLEYGLLFEDYYLEFLPACHPRRVTFSPQLLVTGTRPYPLENGKIIRLNHHLFDDDAIILTDVSSSVSLKSDKGHRSVTVTYPDMSFLGLWHAPKTDAPYICIEPWASLPSRHGIVEDLQKQPDLIKLDSRKTYKNRWWIDFA